MNNRTILDVQRDFALSCGLGEEIIWDLLLPDQSNILRQKIETVIGGPEHRNTKTFQQMRTDLFQNVWAQRKYTNGNLLSTIIYVLVTDQPVAQLELAKQAISFTCHPVFRTRKCISQSPFRKYYSDPNCCAIMFLDANRSAGCCMVFLDEHARVYFNWQQYINDNTLPKGTMVAPVNGVYNFDSNDHVLLECHATPASRTGRKIIRVIDNIATGSELISVLALATATVIPVSGPIMAAATAVAVTTNAYSAVRSGIQLNNRRIHNQTLGLNNRQARKSWLGVTTGIVGVGATGATKALSCAAEAGKDINIATKLTITGINASSVLLSGSGIANSVYDLFVKIRDDDSVSSLDILQLSNSLVVFTHSINNMSIASKVTTAISGNKILNLRDELTQKMHRMHTKLARQINNTVDVIRTVNDIPTINGMESLITALNQIIGTTSDSHMVMRLGSSALKNALYDFRVESDKENVDILALSLEFGSKFIDHICHANSFMTLLKIMFKCLEERIVRFLIELTKTFIDQHVNCINRELNAYISTETVLYKILLHSISCYSDFSHTFLESKTLEILGALEKYFKSMNPVGSTNANRKACKICNGYYYISL